MVKKNGYGPPDGVIVCVDTSFQMASTFAIATVSGLVFGATHLFFGQLTLERYFGLRSIPTSILIGIFSGGSVGYVFTELRGIARYEVTAAMFVLLVAGCCYDNLRNSRMYQIKHYGRGS